MMMHGGMNPSNDERETNIMTLELNLTDDTLTLTNSDGRFLEVILVETARGCAEEDSDIPCTTGTYQLTIIDDEDAEGNPTKDELIRCFAHATGQLGGFLLSHLR